LQFRLVDANLNPIRIINGDWIMEMHESSEDYLEKILMLQKRLGQVRSIDIVNELGFSKPSVSIAMKKFRENGYIEMDGENLITLTASGAKVARRIYARHQTLAKLLVQLGVSQETAEKDACKIEHDISDESFARIKKFLH
jgi:Mn-dependent DtxR family transcriptional regulator